MKPDAAFLEALTYYAETIQEKGWEAGEPLIEEFSEQFKDFRRWAYAAGVMLRAKEILDARKE